MMPSSSLGGTSSSLGGTNLSIQNFTKETCHKELSVFEGRDLCHKGNKNTRKEKHWKTDPKKKRVGLHFCIMSYSCSWWVKWVDGHSGALRGTPFFDNEFDKELGGFIFF